MVNYVKKKKSIGTGAAAETIPPSTPASLIITTLQSAKPHGGNIRQHSDEFMKPHPTASPSQMTPITPLIPIVTHPSPDVSKIAFKALYKLIF